MNNLKFLKINILTEILGQQPSEEVQDCLLETINALWLEFETVPELNSKIEVDLYGFIFKFTMEQKTYKYTSKELHIVLTYILTDEIL